MRCLFIVLSLSLFPAAGLAQSTVTPRPLGAVAAATYARAFAGSAKVRSLVDRLEASNVIVHIVTVPQMPAGLGGTTRFVTNRGGYRYVRITLGADLAPRVRAGILGHELQHAVEIAESSAADVAGMRELFKARGQRSGELFETAAAMRIEREVLMELRARTSLQAQPVIK